MLDRPKDTTLHHLVIHAPNGTRSRLSVTTHPHTRAVGAVRATCPQIVASQGRTFTGTWFSTFSAYICRLRAYYGFEDQTCYWYSPPAKLHAAEHWEMPSHAFYPREWPLAWEGIDGPVPRDLRARQLEQGAGTLGKSVEMPCWTKDLACKAGRCRCPPNPEYVG